MRFRITVRGPGVELRGYVDDLAVITQLGVLADNMSESKGIVAVSPAADNYDPFKEQDARELHHFETEQMLDAVKAEVDRKFVDSPEYGQGMFVWLAKTLERIGIIVGSDVSSVIGNDAGPIKP